MSTPGTATETHHVPVSPWMVLLTVMLGTLLIGLDRTVVSLGLPKIIIEFGSTVSTAGWVATAYIISNAIFVPVFGKLGDMFGNRIIYLWSFIAFVIFSFLAGLSWNMGSLIFFRALQGLVGAAVYPTALSLIAKTFHEPKARMQAMGIWSASFAVSSAFGPLVGGPLIDAFSWRMLFYINLPIGFIGIVMTLLFLNKDKPEEKRHGFDYKGTALLGTALTSLVIVLDRGSDWGWSSLASLTAFVVAFVFAVWFYLVERSVKNPLIDLKFFRDRTFNLVNIISFISFGGMMGSFFLIPLFAQLFLGFNATQTGFLFLPMALMMFIAGPLGGKLTNIFGARIVVGSGTMLGAIAIYMFSFLDPQTTAGDLTFPLMLFAWGIGLSLAPLTNLATAHHPHNEVGIASAIVNLVRNLAGAVAIAVFGTVLTSTTENNVLAVSANTVINNPDPNNINLISGLIILKSQILAYGNVFLYASAVMAIGSITAFLFLKSTPKDDGMPSHRPAIEV